MKKFSDLFSKDNETAGDDPAELDPTFETAPPEEAGFMDAPVEQAGFMDAPVEQENQFGSEEDRFSFSFSSDESRSEGAGLSNETDPSEYGAPFEEESVPTPDDALIQDDGQAPSFDGDEPVVEKRKNPLKKLFKKKEENTKKKEEKTKKTTDKSPAEKQGFVSMIKSKLKGQKNKDPKELKEDQVDDGQEKTADGLRDIKSSGLTDFEFDGGSIFTISKKRIVMGLLWDSARAGESISQQAKAASTDLLQFDLVANYKNGNQLGFAATSSGIKPGFKAGVTCFSEDVMGTSWIAAFQIGRSDTYWVCGMRNGQVYEDQLVQNADEARFIFLDNLQAPGWQRRICPEDWDLGGTESYLLQDALSVSVGLSIKPVNALKTYLPRIIGGVVVVSVAIGGFLFYSDYKEKERQRQEELDQQRRDEVRVSPADYPWFDTPDLTRFAVDCVPTMENLLRIIPGWRQEIIACRFDTSDKHMVTSTTWTNESSTVPWIISAFDPSEAPVTLSEDGSSASYATITTFDVQTDILDEAWDTDKLDRILNQRVQTTGVDVRIIPVVRRVTPQQRADLRRPVFNYHEISFTTSTGILEYFQLFSDIPALVPSDMVYDVNSRAWNVVFRAYHAPILPL